MAIKAASTQKRAKVNRNSNKQSNDAPNADPRTAHKEDQITNAAEQKEIINEPLYKTDREEEENTATAPEDNSTAKNPEAIKKEQPEAEA